MVPEDCKISGGSCSLPLNIANIGDDKCKELSITFQVRYTFYPRSSKTDENSGSGCTVHEFEIYQDTQIIA